MFGLPWWAWLLGGLIVGWVLEWLFELWYYRRKWLEKSEVDFEMRTELATARQEVALVRGGSEMNGLRSDLSSALTAKANVEGQLKSANLDLGGVKTKLSALQGDFDKLTAEHKLRLDEVGSLKANLASLSASLKDKEAELGKARLDWDGQLKVKTAEFENNRLSWTNQVKSHELELGKLKTEHQGKLGEIATLTAAGVAAATELKAKEARIGELENELRLSQQRFVELEGTHKGHEANWQTRLATLQGDFDTSASHRNELEANLKARELELSDARIALDGLGSSKAKLEVALADVQKEAAGLRGQLAGLQSAHTQLVSAHADLGGKLKLVESDHGNTRNLFVALQGDFDQSRANVGALQAELAGLKSEHQSKLGELAALVSARGNLETGMRARDLELSDARVAIDQLSQQKLALEGTVADLRGQVSTLQGDLTQLRNVHANVSAAHAALEDKLKWADTEHGNTRMQFASLQGDFVKLKDDQGAAANETIALRGRLGELETGLTARVAEVSDLNARVAALQTDLDGALAGRGDIALTLKAREKELADAGVRIGDLNAKLAALQEEHEQLHISRDDLEGRLKLVEGDMSQQKSTWQNELAAKETVLADLNMQIASLRGEHESLKTTHSSKVGEIATLMAGAAASATAIKAKEDELVTLRSEYENTLSARQSALSDATVRINALQGNLSELTGTRDQLQGTVRELQGKVDGLQTQLAGLQGEYDLALAARNELEGKLKSVDEEYGQTRTQFASLQTDFVRLKDDHGSASNEASTLRTRIGELETTLNDKQLEWDGLKLAWQNDLAAKDTALADLNGRVVTLQGEHDRLKATHGSKLSEISTLMAGAAASATALKAKDDELATLRSGYEVALKDAQARVVSLQSNLDAANGLRSRIGELESSLVAKDATLADLNARILTLQSEHDTLKGTHGSKLGEIATLMAGAAASATVLKTKEDEIATLNKRLSQVQLELSAKADDAQDKGTRLLALQQEWTRVNEGRSKLEGVVTDLQRELGDLRGQLTGARINYDELSRTHAAALQSCEADKAQWQARLSSLEVTVQDQTRGLADSRAQALHLQQTVDQLTGERAQLQDNLRVQQETLGQTNTRWQDLQVEYERLKTEHGSKSSEIASLMSGANTSALALQNKDNEINLLRAQLAEVSGALQDATNTRSQLTAQLHDAGARADSLQGEIAQLQATQQEQQNKIGAITASLASVESARQQRETELTQLRAELQAAGQSKRELQEQIDALDGEATSARIKLSDLNTRLNAREEETKSARARLSGLEADLTARDRDLANARWRIGEMEAELARLQQANQELAVRPSTGQAESTAAQAPDASVEAAEVALPSVGLVSSGSSAPEAMPVGFVSAVAPEAVEAAPPQSTAQILNKGFADEAAAQAGVSVKRSECPQHLSEVQGIGTVFEQRLYEYGIGTYWELAHMSDADLRKALKLDEIAAGSKGARMVKVDFEAIRADALRLAKETEAEGRIWADGQPDDFEPIDGIGHTFELRLYNAGICTYEALIAATVERLAEVCKPPKRFKTPDYKGWQAKAAALLAQKQGKP